MFVVVWLLIRRVLCAALLIVEVANIPILLAALQLSYDYFVWCALFLFNSPCDGVVVVSLLLSCSAQQPSADANCWSNYVALCVLFTLTYIGGVFRAWALDIDKSDDGTVFVLVLCLLVSIGNAVAAGIFASQHSLSGALYFASLYAYLACSWLAILCRFLLTTFYCYMSVCNTLLDAFCCKHTPRSTLCECTCCDDDE